ncbi:MAG: NAD(P)-dependent oxidoreductase [Chitinophagales bacterium]
MKKKILLTEDFDPVLFAGLSALGYECDQRNGISHNDVLKIIQQYYGIIVATRIEVDKEMIDQTRQLKFIARAGSGMENIEVDYAVSRHISCINSPEGNADSVGEHAAGLLLALFHNIARSFLQTRNSEWLVEENRVHELEGKTIAIIGYGNTGRSLARKLSSFNMTVLAYDKYLNNYGDSFARESTMDQIYHEAEIISFHLPLTAETSGMINEQYLQRFSNPLHLINTSRGKIIQHRQLLEAIENGRITSAGLDVYENENFAMHNKEHRDVFFALNQTGKVIFTPHIAGKSFESKKKIAEILIQKISMLT